MTALTVPKQILGFIGWLVLSFSASAIGAIASIEARSFYSELIQPSWAPAGWVFGPVWTTLFTLMAISAFLVWREGGFSKRKLALSLFISQLVVNALWSWLFFAWQLGGLAFYDILLLIVLISATMATFWQASRIAALLLVPYLCWVSFAGFLNFSLWQLNPSLL